MANSAISKVVKQYFKTTTMHGFKYLYSEYYVDSILWVVCCCASACCAGVLSAVLWERFLDVPTVLALSRDMHTSAVEDQVPAIAICPPTDRFDDIIREKLNNPNEHIKLQISNTLADIVTGKSVVGEKLQILREFLHDSHISLQEIMKNLTMSCNEQVSRCRYQKVTVPCDRLFKIEFTSWGVCCVMRAKRLLDVVTRNHHITQMLDLVTQCSNGSQVFGCQLITLYNGEDNGPEWVTTSNLKPGNFYMTQLRFLVVPANPYPDPSSTAQAICVPDDGYSRSRCMQKCAEKACGCKDPLLFISRRKNMNPHLSECPLSKLSCLRDEYNNSCYCLPSCKKITTIMVLESIPMDAIESSVDSFYSDVNITSSMVINLRVNVELSRLFVLNPTETWFTLLSSLGGVFNMFLGVGLFSALEFLYFIFVKLPIAIRNSSETDLSPHPYIVHRY